MKKILIVGGAGFIGHNLAINLKKNGNDVLVVDSLEVNNLASIESNVDNIPYPILSKKIIHERLDLLKKNNIDLKIQDARDYDEISKIVNTYKPDVLVHLAAVSHSNRSNKNPYSTFDHSLRTLENTLDSVKDNVGHFIFFSSSMVYGNFKKDEVTEDLECNPIGIYGTLKYAAEKIIIAYNQVFKTPYTIVRPSALYGERCVSRRVGQIFIENVLNKKDIIISGNGNDKLDFTYIDDLISGVNKIINNSNSINQIFNITYGNSRRIIDLVEILKKFYPNIKVNFEKQDKLTPKRGTLSIKKAKKLLNYQPSWSIDEGYVKYIKWYQNFYKNV